MARCVCGHKEKWHFKVGARICNHLDEAGENFSCRCEGFVANEKPEKVGVDIKRVRNDLLTIACAMSFVKPRTWLEVSVESGELEESQWVSAALGCNDDKELIEIAIEGFVSAIKAGDYDLHLEPPAGKK